MKLLFEDKNIQIIKIDIKDFLKDRENFINSFTEISTSNNLEETFNLENFFQKYQTYSVICAIKNNKIVSYLYGTKINEYSIYKNVESNEWHIGYIKTHFNYQHQGIGTHVLLAGILDMIKQGANKIHYIPNEQSNSLFEQIVAKRNCLNIQNESFGRKVLIKNKTK